MKLDPQDDTWKSLWRNVRKAPPEEKWKWDHALWEGVKEQIWEGDIEHLICPVCQHENVYFKYLVFAQYIEHGEEVRLADRWIGCENCGTQIRETAFVPSWLTDPEWNPGARKLES